MDFEKNGYAVKRKVITKEIVELVTQYALFDEMQNPDIGDSQIDNAHSKYADPLMESLLLKLHPIMETETGLSLYPTYSYYRIYRNGDELKYHTDRPSCEISATLSFDYEYTNKNFKWPIFMNGTPIDLNPGDIALYKGCEIPHWREKLHADNDDWHVQGFFHYVDKNGAFTAHRFDQRSSIGERPKKQKRYQNLPDYIDFYG